MNEIKTLAEELGRAPKRREYIRSGMAIKKFGSWNNFVKAAKLTPRDPGKSVTNSKKRKRHTLESLMELALQMEIDNGRFPSYREYPYFESVMQRFQTWNKFVATCEKRKCKKD
ncbi:hypothetical protein HCI99_16990 [Listeria booriae]|uniref:Uncharacterized protein n=2 Tax=Listeria booriae TaxID=1552123 RepID=A0A7X0XG47_9LIST|nr:hypothetical protein [Listeria booriae]